MLRKYLYIIVPLAVLALSLTAALGAGPPPLEAETVAASPQLQNTCTVHYTKTASPGKVKEGGVVDVTLSVQATDCTPVNSPVDVALVIDRSGSMGGTKIADAKQAAIDFVNQTGGSDQVALSSFAGTGTATLDQTLTNNKTAVINAINSLNATGMTDIAEGLAQAETELDGTRHINTNAPVIILLSDGYHNQSGDLPGTAARIKGKGIRIITIGLGSGVDEQQLKDTASSANDYYYAPSSSDLANIYQSIMGQTLRVAARDMVITDTLSADVSLVSGSFSGPVAPTVNGQTIVWNVGQVSKTAMTFSYQVVMPTAAGIYDTNASAVATYLDPANQTQTITFPKPKVEVEASCGPPNLVDMDPKWVCVNESKDLSFYGGGFYAANLSAWIDGQSLNVTQANQQTVNATLAAGLSAGTYDAKITNHCPAGDQSSTLNQIFNIYPPPNILSIRPPEGLPIFETEITICGDGFAVPGTTAYIKVGGNKIPLLNQAAYGDQCLLGGVPPGYAPGLYDIIVEGPCGTATGQYRVLDSTLNNDLFGQEFWVDPGICARVGDTIKIGAVIHRRGGKNPVNVVVRFYEGDPNQGGSLIGDGQIPLFPPRAGTAIEDLIAGKSTSEVAWTPSVGEGLYTLYAVIDPDNTIAEDTETNNVISRTVRILPGTDGDTVAPVVDDFKANLGGNAVFTRNVELHIQASDNVNPGVPSSGVNSLKIVELVFNESAGVWVPVAQSQWEPFPANNTYHWSLAPRGGLRYLQAWVSDNNANVSRYPYLHQINYLQQCDPLPFNGTRTYRFTLNKGDTLWTSVVPCDGDPDLYVWPPDWASGGRAPRISNQYGTATEEVAWTVPKAGVYQVEVYGYQAGSYSFSFDIQPAGSGTTALDASAGVTDKPKPDRPGLNGLHPAAKPKVNAPVVPPDSRPDQFVAASVSPPDQGDTSSEIYLPYILK